MRVIFLKGHLTLLFFSNWSSNFNLKQSGDSILIWLHQQVTWSFPAPFAYLAAKGNESGASYTLDGVAAVKGQPHSFSFLERWTLDKMWSDRQPLLLSFRAFWTPFEDCLNVEWRRNIATIAQYDQVKSASQQWRWIGKEG